MKCIGNVLVGNIGGVTGNGNRFEGGAGTKQTTDPTKVEMFVWRFVVGSGEVDSRSGPRGPVVVRHGEVAGVQKVLGHYELPGGVNVEETFRRTIDEVMMVM